MYVLTNIKDPRRTEQVTLSIGQLILKPTLVNQIGHPTRAASEVFKFFIEVLSGSATSCFL